MTYQNDHANRQTAHGLRPLRVICVKIGIGFAVLCGAGRGLVWSAALQIFVFLCRPCRFGKTAAAIGRNAAMATS